MMCSCHSTFCHKICFMIANGSTIVPSREENDSSAIQGKPCKQCGEVSCCCDGIQASVRLFHSP